MHNQLEKYLSQIEDQLAALPAEQRQEELREIRSHLEMMIEENIARGCDAKEALTKTLEQFGSAEKIGQDLKHIYTNRNENARTVLAGLTVCIILIFSFYALSWLHDTFSYTWNRNSELYFSFCILWFVAFLGGWIAECIAPKKKTLPLVVIFLYLSLFCVAMFGEWVTSGKFVLDLGGDQISAYILPIYITLTGIWLRRRHWEHRKEQRQIIVE
ncbi:MAG: permease prefix domain 1-containing protein [Abditibacteriaceae bacterium]